MAAIGAAPDRAGSGEPEPAVDIVPVDYVAAAIVRLSPNPDAQGRAHHRNRTELLPVRALEEALREAGYRIEGLRPDVSRDRPAAATEEAVSAGGGALVAAMLLSDRNPGRSAVDLRYDQSNTLSALADSGIECPPVDAALLGVCVRYLAGTGFLPPLPAWRGPRNRGGARRTWSA
ncbi:hypothetical protein, partial [Streptomyces lavendulae]|uniref:hypothetical protein n=1 Tax=Streptomyces lavendulae TaxID=1914 RepID=UPI0034021626